MLDIKYFIFHSGLAMAYSNKNNEEKQEKKGTICISFDESDDKKMNDVLQSRWDILEASMNDEEREFGTNQKEQLTIEIKKILANIVNNGY